jgi:iron-sulfur cluster assembly protein
MERVIELTPRAAAHIRRHLTAQPPGTALRLGIRRTGCSGYAYTLDYAGGEAGDDHVAHCDGLAIRIGRDALPVLTGTTVDLVRDGLNEKFVFQNPHAGESCGCGESFTLRG